jgi:hypothetical protein
VLCCFACRKDCEVLASQLVAAGLTAAHYHADMEPAARQAAHSSWSSGAVQVRNIWCAPLSSRFNSYYLTSLMQGVEAAAYCLLCLTVVPVQ